MALISVSSITERTETLTVKFVNGGLDIQFNVTYFPGHLSLETRRKMADADDIMEGVVQFLLTMVKEWELGDDDGKMLPLTEEVLKRFEVSFLSTIGNAIFDACLPGEDIGGSSDAG